MVHLHTCTEAETETETETVVVLREERFNTLDATINHVKLIDVFQYFTSVLV